MKLIAVAACLLMISSTAIAGESKPLELPDTSKMNVPAAKSGTTVEISCTTVEGRKLKSGEAGYETCVSASSSNMKNKANSNPSGTATSVDFKFGK